MQVTALCDAAKKAGVTLDEDDQHEIDEQFSYIELAAKQYKYNSVSKYLQAAYGNGVTKKVVRHMLEMSQLATKYSQQQYDSYTYTPEQIAASYAEKKGQLRHVQLSVLLRPGRHGRHHGRRRQHLCQDHGRHDGGRQGHGRQDRRCHA